VTQSLDAFAQGKPVAILGDLNALTRSDYSDVEWESIEAVNNANGWSRPRHGCLSLLHAAGYKDAWVLSSDCSSNGEAKGWTAHVHDPRYRIDYGFLGPQLLQQMDLVACRVVEEMTGSDHFPLLFDLELRSQSALARGKCAL